MDDGGIQKWSWCAVALASVAAVGNGFGLQWVVVGFVLASLACSGIGLGHAQGIWNDMVEACDLQERWRRERERGR